MAGRGDFCMALWAFLVYRKVPLDFRWDGVLGAAGKETMVTVRSGPGRIAAGLMRIRYVREAVAEKADLSGLSSRPTLRTWTGLGMMAFSYVIGWPAVGLLVWLSYRLREPLVAVVGGTLAYGLSHLVFMAGAALAGVDYAKPVLRWAVRRLVERLNGRDAVPESEETNDRPGKTGVEHP